MLGLLLAAAAHGDEGRGLLDLPFAELSVGSPAAPIAVEEIPIDGPFRLVGVVKGIRTYEAPLPVRPRALFYASAPPGMTLHRGTAGFHFGGDADDGGRPGTWQFTADAVQVRIKAQSAGPRAGEFTLTYPAATEREDALWRTRSKAASDADFVLHSAQVDDVTRDGLHLPVPSVAGWDLPISAGGILRFDLGVLPPEAAGSGAGARSDGADLIVRVDGEKAGAFRTTVGRFEAVRVPLDRWAGRTVRVSLSTVDTDSAHDHVFVAAPSLYVPPARPKRLLLVFIDTLRRDHLGMYGATRGASPTLDAWAEQAVVFEDARSVAPWTLPSARSALSGLQPEHWEGARSLPMRLADAGWATGAFVGNVYLSSNFDMADGWGEHGCVNWPYARVQVDRGLDFLDRHADQDAVLMVHFMDMHLPYKEPAAYRHIYEGPRPAALPEGFNRNTLLAAAKGNRSKVKDYLIARYDQNLRYIDAEVKRLLRAVGTEATVVLFADHGEEFFDHGDLEHGHSLYDELLRVPMAISGPGLGARRVPGPVSLLDLTPTVLDLLGHADRTLAGHSLAGAARGEPDAAVVDRPIAFGRPLYGNEAWGSVRSGVKYLSRSGKELLFDLGLDPGETEDLRHAVEPTRGRAALAGGLGRPVGVGYRLSVKGRGNTDLRVEITVPGGIADVWVGDDPTQHSEAAVSRDTDERATATFLSSRGSHREVFVIPRQDAVATAPTVEVRVAGVGPSGVRLAALPFDGAGAALGELRVGGHTLTVTYAVVPLPAGKAAPGADPELQGALEMLGYSAREEGGAPEGSAPTPENKPRSDTP